VTVVADSILASVYVCDWADTAPYFAQDFIKSDATVWSLGWWMTSALRQTEEPLLSRGWAGVADAGRYTTISSAEDSQRLHARLMAQVRESLATGK
jgi:hypothetical protein